MGLFGDFEFPVSGWIREEIQFILLILSEKKYLKRIHSF